MPESSGNFRIARRHDGHESGFAFDTVEQLREYIGIAFHDQPVPTVERKRPDGTWETFNLDEVQRG